MRTRRPASTFWPIPFEAIARHPRTPTLTPTQFGMLSLVGIHFCETRCAPLPLNTETRMAIIARSHLKTWRNHKKPILAILEAALPPIQAYYAKRDAAHAGLSNAAHSGNSTRRLNALKNSLSPPAPTPTPHRDYSLPQPTPPPTSDPAPRLWTDRAA